MESENDLESISNSVNTLDAIINGLQSIAELKNHIQEKRKEISLINNQL